MHLSIVSKIIIFLTLIQVRVGCAVVRRGLGGRDLKTNAERFARGYPPLPPPNLFKRSPTGKPKPKPSNLVVPLTGNVKITKRRGGGSLGFVSNHFILTKEASETLSVTFTPTKAHFDIRINSPANGKYPFLGFSGGNLETHSVDPTAHSLAGTALTPPRSPPVNVGNSFNNGPSESSIWIYDFATKRLSAQWINANHATPPTYIWYIPATHSITLISDLAFAEKLHPGGFEVIFTFAP